VPCIKVSPVLLLVVAHCLLASKLPPKVGALPTLKRLNGKYVKLVSFTSQIKRLPATKPSEQSFFLTVAIQ
jgi:hypothetical protein